MISVCLQCVQTGAERDGRACRLQLYSCLLICDVYHIFSQISTHIAYLLICDVSGYPEISVATSVDIRRYE
jgi:hypothetical protein